MYNLKRNKEHLNSSMRFQGDGVATRVPLTFDLKAGDGLAIDFGRGLVDAYTLDANVTPKVLIFDEPLPKDTTVTIRRLTYIDKPKHIFQYTGNAQGGAEFSAVNIDENFEQITRASQDAMDAQVLSSQTMEEMAGIRDDALDARDRAVLAETNAKASEVSANASEAEARREASNAASSASGSNRALEEIKPLHADVVRLAPEVKANTDKADASAEAAKVSETNAKASENRAANMAASASSSASVSTNAANRADASANSASTSASKASTSERNAKGSEDRAKQWADKAEEIGGFNPALYRKKDDLVFKGLMQVHAPDAKGTGIFFIDPSGKPRGQVTSNSVGLQFAQYHTDDTAQTFTLPRVGGELTTTSQLNTKQDKLTFKGTGNVVKESVTNALESSVYQAQLSANTALQTAQSKQDKLEFVGSGKVMKEGAYGLGNYTGNTIDSHNFKSKESRQVGFYSYGNDGIVAWGSGIHIGDKIKFVIGRTAPILRVFSYHDSTTEFTYDVWHTLNTKTDKNGVLHAGTGSVNVTATEAWVKSQGYITAGGSGTKLGDEQLTSAGAGSTVWADNMRAAIERVPANSVMTRVVVSTSGGYSCRAAYRPILRL